MATKHHKSRTKINKESSSRAKWPANLLKRPHFISMLILLLSMSVFYHEVLFGGKSFLPPDRLSSRSVATFLDDSFERGEYPQWNPYLYGGMPSFASLQSAPYIDFLGEIMKLITNPLGSILGSDFTRYFSNYLLLGVLAYIFIFRKTASAGIALFAGLTLVFQPPISAFGAYGHGSKLTTVALIPLIFLLVDELLEKRNLRIFVLLALAVGSQLLRAHTQMAYYTFMMVGLYLIYWLIYSRRLKLAWSDILKPLAWTIAALFVGVVMSSLLYLPVLEYSDYSIRGGGTGLDYGYATNWSFSPAEVMTFFVPSFLGFGGPTYWGGMPFTDFPLYMGIVPLMLAVAALVLRRDKYTLFFAILGLLALAVSFGKSLPVLYDLLFNYLPFFNKFRIPSMILVLLQFSVVALAAFGLQHIHGLTDPAGRDKLRKFVYVFIGVCGVFMLFMLAAKGTYLEWAAAAKKLSAAGQQRAYDLAAGDATKTFFLAAAAGTFILLHIQGKLRNNFFLVAITALAVLDLWLVDFKLGDPKPRASESQYFAETEAARFLKEADGPFRIYQAYDDKPENWYMYHRIQNIHGYQTARLRIYDEFLEKSRFLGPRRRNRYGLPAFLDKYYTVGLNSSGQAELRIRPPEQVESARTAADNAVLDMLNVKYLISYYPLPDSRFKQVLSAQPAVFENTQVLPRAFFVDSVQVVSSDDQFYAYLATGRFNPASEAVLHEPVGTEIQSGAPNRVSIEHYDFQEIRLRADVQATALLVLSEVYYPAGWQAYVDGEETKIHRTNGVLRSIVVQPGAKEIVFAFSSASFNTGLTITATTVLLLIGLLIYDLKFRKPATAHEA